MNSPSSHQAQMIQKPSSRRHHDISSNNNHSYTRTTPGDENGNENVSSAHHHHQQQQQQKYKRPSTAPRKRNKTRLSQLSGKRSNAGIMNYQSSQGMNGEIMKTPAASAGNAFVSDGTVLQDGSEQQQQMHMDSPVPYQLHNRKYETHKNVLVETLQEWTFSHSPLGSKRVANRVSSYPVSHSFTRSSSSTGATSHLTFPMRPQSSASMRQGANKHHNKKTRRDHNMKSDSPQRMHSRNPSSHPAAMRPSTAANSSRVANGSPKHRSNSAKQSSRQNRRSKTPLSNHYTQNIPRNDMLHTVTEPEYLDGGYPTRNVTPYTDMYFSSTDFQHNRPSTSSSPTRRKRKSARSHSQPKSSRASLRSSQGRRSASPSKSVNHYDILEKTGRRVISYSPATGKPFIDRMKQAPVSSYTPSPLDYDSASAFDRATQAKSFSVNPNSREYRQSMSRSGSISPQKRRKSPRKRSARGADYCAPEALDAGRSKSPSFGFGTSKKFANTPKNSPGPIYKPKDPHQRIKGAVNFGRPRTKRRVPPQRSTPSPFDYDVDKAKGQVYKRAPGAFICG